MKTYKVQVTKTSTYYVQVQAEDVTGAKFEALSPLATKVTGTENEPSFSVGAVLSVSEKEGAK